MPNKWLEFVKQYREQNPDLNYSQALSQARNEYVPVSIDRKQTRVDNMKTKVKENREKVSDKKNKVQLRTLKAELDELESEQDELESLETLSKDEKAELKSIKRKINSTMKKLDAIPSKARGLQLQNLQKKSVDIPIHGGSYGLSVMPSRISGSGKMSVYGGGSII
jgi:chromosome segregation ATPase